MTVPDGAQRSEDGYYWWDGSDWKQVPEDDPQHPSKAAAPTSSAAAAGASSAAAAAGTGAATGGSAAGGASAGGAAARGAAAGGAASAGAAAGGELTKEDLQHITSEDQIDEKAHPYFAPDYDAVPDDVSMAEAAADLSEPSGVS